MDDVKNRYEKLKAQLAEYAYEYYVLDSTSVEDSVYDGLMNELKKIETKYPKIITSDSPTQRVGGKPLEGFKSVAHSTRMLSLNDVFEIDGITDWVKRTDKLLDNSEKREYLADIKMDGLACALVYQDGIFIQAITRGDGFIGEDVTTNVRTISSVPLKFRVNKNYPQFLKGRAEVRGEIVMYKVDFEKLNLQRENEGLPLYANPRNTSAGTIRQLDPELVSKRTLYFRSYDLQPGNTNEVPTHSFAYSALQDLGFIVNKHHKVITEVTDIISFINKWETDRHELPFNTDGLVVKVNNRKLYDRLGIVGKAPRGAIAYKYPAEKSTTKLKDIFISIGRTGAATPVAILEPVVVAGSTVQMATLHNQGEISRKDIRIGDTVIIHKAGDIIPEVVEPIINLRTGNETKFVMPTNCPECGDHLEKQENEAVWRCTNTQCPARVQNQIQHYASKVALDIEGMGEKNVLSLLDAKLINDVADIYSLKKEDILNLERFAEVSAQKLIDAINAKKTPQLSKFIFGLGIRHVGAQTAIDLANKFKRLDTLGTASYADIKDVDGVGEIVAESILAWFEDSENQNLLTKFKSSGVWPVDVKVMSTKLVGQKFVVTGSLETMGREQAGDKIRELGGTFQSSVGKETDYLVVGANVGASKLEKAKKLGVKTINEKEFLKLL